MYNAKILLITLKTGNSTIKTQDHQRPQLNLVTLHQYMYYNTAVHIIAIIIVIHYTFRVIVTTRSDIIFSIHVHWRLIFPILTINW